MPRRNFVPWLLVILFCLMGLSLLLLTFLPFETLKAFLNVFSKDKNLSMLRPDDAVVFRFLIGTIGLGILGLAYLTGKRQWKLVLNFFKQFWQDARSFFSFSITFGPEMGFFAALLVVMAIAVIRRLVFIESPMLHDEAYTVVTFSDTFFHAMTDYSLPNNHIFHTILVVLSIKMFGLAPWTARLPAFLAGV